MSTALQTQRTVTGADGQPIDVSFIPEAAFPVLNREQISWLIMGYKKNQLIETLTKNELDVQNIIKNMQAINVTGLQLTQMQEKLTEIQTKLAEAKQKRDAGQAQRTAYTQLFENGIKKPLMVYEGRNDAYVNTGTQWEFQMRSLVVVEQKKIEDKSKEEAAYEAHIRSELFRIGQAYRDELYRLYTDAYKIAVSTKEKKILTFKTALIVQLKAVKLVPGVQYQRKLVDDKRAGEIYNGIEKYNSVADLSAAIDGMEKTFLMFEQDIKNSEAALTKITEEQAAAEAASTAAVEQEKGIQNLVASAGTFSFEGGAKIKKNVVVVEVNSDEWMMRVIQHYLANFEVCKKHIRVAEKANIKIGQMATALGKYATETGLEFDGLELKEVAK